MLHAWEELPYPSNQDTAAWAFMAQQLQFRPSVLPEHWPTIVEPFLSITYDIGQMYGLSQTPNCYPYLLDLNRTA